MAGSVDRVMLSVGSHSVDTFMIDGGSTCHVLGFRSVASDASGWHAIAGGDFQRCADRFRFWGELAFGAKAGGRGLRTTPGKGCLHRDGELVFLSRKNERGLYCLHVDFLPCNADIMAVADDEGQDGDPDAAGDRGLGLGGDGRRGFQQWQGPGTAHTYFTQGSLPTFVRTASCSFYEGRLHWILWLPLPPPDGLMIDEGSRAGDSSGGPHRVLRQSSHVWGEDIVFFPLWTLSYLRRALWKSVTGPHGASLTFPFFSLTRHPGLDRLLPGPLGISPDHAIALRSGGGALCRKGLPSRWLLAEMSARDLKKLMACALAIAISEALQRLSTYVCR